MRVNREELLKCLVSVSPGLTQREVIEQSSCFVFQNGDITTFNDEVSVSVKSPCPGIEGAVPSQKLLDLLSRLTEDDLEIEIASDGLRIKGTGRRALIRIESEIAASAEPDRVGEPSQWRPLHADFGAAIGIVQACSSKDDSQFVLTCIHITPDFVEACDDKQLARYLLMTGLHESSCLVRRTSIVPIQGLGMSEVGITDAWLHFRNHDNGLRYSCRRWVNDEWIDLDDLVDKVEGATATMPAGLAEAVAKAEVFSVDSSIGQSNEILVELKGNKLRLRGEGAGGWFEERKQVVWDGDPLSFRIDPQLLVEITKRTKECTIAPKRLRVDAGNFVYVVALKPMEITAGS